MKRLLIGMIILGNFSAFPNESTCEVGSLNQFLTTSPANIKEDLDRYFEKVKEDFEIEFKSDGKYIDSVVEMNMKRELLSSLAQFERDYLTKQGEFKRNYISDNGENPSRIVLDRCNSKFRSESNLIESYSYNIVSDYLDSIEKKEVDLSEY